MKTAMEKAAEIYNIALAAGLRGDKMPETPANIEVDETQSGEKENENE